MWWLGLGLTPEKPKGSGAAPGPADAERWKALDEMTAGECHTHVRE